MATYRVGALPNPERGASAWFRRFLPLFFIYVAIRVLLDRLWPGPSSESVLRATISGAVWAAAFTLAVSKFGSKLGLHYDLVVSEDEITAKYAIAFKTVHKGKVRTILERGRWLLNRPGIVASERGQLGAWLWGGVFIPQDLPEYERLRETILSWKA